MPFDIFPWTGGRGFDIFGFCAYMGGQAGMVLVDGWLRDEKMMMEWEWQFFFFFRCSQVLRFRFFESWWSEECW